MDVLPNTFSPCPWWLLTLIATGVKLLRLLSYGAKGSGGTRWRSWLRQWGTNPEVAGSIPDGMSYIFHWPNPSGQTMALGSNLPVRRPVHRACHLYVPSVGTATSWSRKGQYRHYFIILCHMTPCYMTNLSPFQSSTLSPSTHSKTSVNFY
jgi:hypothetical protein